MQKLYVFSTVAIVVRHWYEIGVEDEEHGCRVEVRRLPRLVHRGTESASQMVLADAPLWRADMFDLVDDSPGNLRRAHFHSEFLDAEPGERRWDTLLSSDPLGWLEARLSNLSETLGEAAVGEAGLEGDQASVTRHLPELLEDAGRRLGASCTSPEECLAQTSDVHYIVPRMVVDIRGAEKGFDPRLGADSWRATLETRSCVDALGLDGKIEPVAGDGRSA